MFANFREWLKSHSAAVLVTIVALQNSHLFSMKVENCLAVIGNILSSVGGQ
jgi:hypothetical protein